MKNKLDTKACVLFISGQSNATAHLQYLKEEDKIYEPMKNVFSLDKNPNQSFDIEDVVWSGWTSMGKNLGETQDHTASLAYFVAKKWQAAIDAGKDLPNLYIVQISFGSQGIINGMWNRDKELVLKPGKLGEGDIALLPLALRTQKLAMENLTKGGLNPKVIGWHWLGCCQEIWNEAYLREDFNERYDYHFDQMIASMGGDVPVYLYQTVLKPACERFDLPLEAEDYINQALDRQAVRLGAKMNDVRKTPLWDENDPVTYGVLYSDRAHALPKVHEWFAERFLEDIF